MCVRKQNNTTQKDFFFKFPIQSRPIAFPTRAKRTNETKDNATYNRPKMDQFS